MRRRALLSAITIAVLALPGCVSLPDSGPVVQAGSEGSFADELGSRYLPNPPQPGESATDIVRHFLEAMTATPIQTNTAAEFLTEDAQASWEPEAQTIVYGDATQPKGQTRVSVVLTDAHRLDSRGVYAGRLPPADRALAFRMTIEEGEWRIADPPDALVVPRYWTDDQFRSVDVYFFDPTAQILVPEPVSVPRGEQFATALTRSLLAGPGPALSQVSRSFLPPQLTLGPLRPVDAEGVVDIALQGDASSMSAEEAELAAVQLAWTLRQDPAIRSIRLTADGQALPGQSSLIPVEDGAEYGPADFSSSTSLFALRDGRLVSGQPDAMTPVDGLAGQQDYGFTDFAVSLDSTRVAGIGGDGTSVLLGPTFEGDGSLDQVVSEATSFLPPVWDFADRLWLVDRAPQGARVILVDRQGPRLVEVPGITGERVRHVLVSRDGSRLVTVVRRPGRVRGGERTPRDQVVTNRIQYDDRGDLLAVKRARRLPWPTGERPRVRDIAWRTATSVAVLYPVRDLAQVRTLAVNGSPANPSVASPTLGGDFRYLIGSPEVGSDLFAASVQGYTDLTEADRSPESTDVDLSTLTYTG